MLFGLAFSQSMSNAILNWELVVIRSYAGLHGFFKTNWWQVLYLLFESLENKRGASPIVINTLTSFKVWADEVPAT